MQHEKQLLIGLGVWGVIVLAFSSALATFFGVAGMVVINGAIGLIAVRLVTSKFTGEETEKMTEKTNNIVTLDALEPKDYIMIRKQLHRVIRIEESGNVVLLNQALNTRCTLSFAYLSAVKATFAGTANTIDELKEKQQYTAFARYLKAFFADAIRVFGDDVINDEFIAHAPDFDAFAADCRAFNWQFDNKGKELQKFF